jgi:hypothetical protein
MLQGFEFKVDAKEILPEFTFNMLGVYLEEEEGPEFKEGDFVVLANNFAGHLRPNPNAIVTTTNIMLYLGSDEPRGRARAGGIIGDNPATAAKNPALLGDHLEVLGFVKEMYLKCRVREPSKVKLITYKSKRWPDPPERYNPWVARVPDWIDLEFFDLDKIREVGTNGVVEHL